MPATTGRPARPAQPREPDRQPVLSHVVQAGALLGALLFLFFLAGFRG